MARGRVYVGTSGYVYREWRGAFYPPELPVKSWIDYACERFDSIELNGTFYSLKSPAAFARWAAAAPPGFVYAVKGSRFITHNLKLGHAEAALANFFASGVLALGRALGPFLWQLPPRLAFDRARFDAFVDLLPRNARDAERLAARHDARLRHGALVRAASPGRYRHAFEVRDPRCMEPELFSWLRRRGLGFVIADTAGRHPYAEEVTADFVYVRLHGSTALYASDYSERELEQWAARVKAWASRGLDVYVYFDNDVHAYAPKNAARLIELLGGVSASRARPSGRASPARRGARAKARPPRASPSTPRPR
ncbi:MAG TPA: DUF72 domain-containing protein [Minicystis sp.]|nr:DUF72 domain-containing protein [Minicystis sp.]